MTDWDRLADGIVNKAKNHVVKTVNSRLPEALRVNPDEYDEEDDDTEEDEEDDEDDGNDAMYLHFAYPDADRNLATAAAAYRVLGETDDVVAVYTPTGEAFFGTVEGLVAFNKSRDLDEKKWEVYDDPEEILDLDYDRDAITGILRQVDNQEDDLKAAQKQYEEFHWGMKAKGTSVVEIPGIAGPLSLLGVARKIEYGAAKGEGGKWEEYYHLHGEESGLFPMVYAGPVPPGGQWPNWYVVCGGKMHITDRGIED